MPDTGYLGLSGAQAAYQREDTLQKLKDLREQERANLKSPQAQLEFDAQTRRLYSDAEQRIGAHAETQYKGWAATVNEDSAQHSLNEGVGNLNNPDPAVAANHFKDYIDYKVRAAQLKTGGDPTAMAEAQDDAKRDIVKAQAASAALTDPKKAQAILDSRRELLGTQYAPLTEALKTKVDQSTGYGIASKVYSQVNAGGPAINPVVAQRAVAAAPGGFSASGLIRAAQIESGGNPNAVSGSHVGLLQAGGPEWAKYGQGSPTDPEAAMFFGARYAAVNAPILQSKLGRPPTDAELYLAHQQGAGGASKLLLNPNMRAGDLVGDVAIRGNGGDPNAPAYQFTSMWAGKFNRTPLSPPPKADGYQMIENDPDVQANPQVHQIAIQRFNQMQTEYEIANNSNAKALQQASETAFNGYMTTIFDLRHSANPDYVALAGQINHDPTITGEKKATLLDRVTKMSGEEQSLSFGPGYLKARDGLFSSIDDPGHIADFSSLVTNPNITTAGLEDLKKRWDLAKTSVDKMGVEKRANFLLADAKKQLSFEEDTPFFKLRDPKGESIFNSQFAPDFTKRVSQLMADSEKTGNSEKLDKFLSKDNLDKMILGYRNPQEMRQAKMAASGQVPETQANAPLPAAPSDLAGVNDDAWHTLIAKPPVRDDGKEISHQAWGNILDALARNPTQETVDNFAKLPIAKGLDGAKIVEALTGHPPTKPAEPGAAAPPAASAPAAPESAGGISGWLGNLRKSNQEALKAMTAPQDLAAGTIAP